MTWLGTRGWGLKAWKYRLAHLLDRRSGTCWAGLVGWVEYGGPLADGMSNDRCRRGAAADGRCYCGKVGEREPEPAPKIEAEVPF